MLYCCYQQQPLLYSKNIISNQNSNYCPLLRHVTPILSIIILTTPISSKSLPCQDFVQQTILLLPFIMAWYSTDFMDNCAPLSFANSATWSKYNSFNSFNWCHEFLIISNSPDYFIVRSRLTFLVVFFEHSHVLTIINQAILYQTTVVIQMQTQIKIKQFKFKFKQIEIWVYLSNQSHCILAKLNVNYQMYQIFMYIILDVRFPCAQYVSYRPSTQPKDNDFVSFSLDLRHQNRSDHY